MEGRLPVFIVTLASLAIVFGNGCLAPAKRGPFRVRAEEFRSAIETIAIQPLFVSPRLVSPERARDKIEHLALAQLETARHVLPSSEWASAWTGIASEIGAIFDERTGEVDAERYAIVDEAVRSQMRRSHGVDAILRLEIVDVDVERPADPVALCGSERRPYFEGPRGPVSLMRKRIVRARGTCLVARFLDIDGRELYAEAYGIEVIETYAMRTRSRRPIGRRLASRRGLEIAVDSVLAPLVAALDTQAD